MRCVNCKNKCGATGVWGCRFPQKEKLNEKDLFFDMDLCQDQLTIHEDANAFFYIYCARLKGHTGKHYYSDFDGERKFRIRWDNPQKQFTFKRERGRIMTDRYYIEVGG